MLGVSHEWCFSSTGVFSKDTYSYPICEAIQFVSGLLVRGEDLLVAYGINDCESSIVYMSLMDALAKVQYVNSRDLDLDEYFSLEL